MNIKQVSAKAWKAGTIVVLVVGLIAAVYLVQTKQIFKSKAALLDTIPGDVKIYQGFDYTDANGNPLECQEEEGRGYVCYTKTRNVRINLNREKLGEAVR